MTNIMLPNLTKDIDILIGIMLEHILGPLQHIMEHTACCSELLAYSANPTDCVGSEGLNWSALHSTHIWTRFAPSDHAALTEESVRG